MALKSPYNVKKRKQYLKKTQNYYLLNNEWGCIVDSQ